MAPELIERGEVSTACDVYAFGILMWEIYTRLQPYKGLGPPQVLMGVVSSQLRPAFASTTPQGFQVRFYTASARVLCRRAASGACGHAARLITELDCARCEKARRGRCELV